MNGFGCSLNRLALLLGVLAPAFQRDDGSPRSFEGGAFERVAGERFARVDHQVQQSSCDLYRFGVPQAAAAEGVVHSRRTDAGAD